MNKATRILSALLAVLFICNITAFESLVFAQGNTITISSREDFIDLSKKCTLDTWSLGKVVDLTCDIDFENEHFPSIPTFGGTFNGNGYTISGVTISKNGSHLGVFRYVQQSGRISNLNVKATLIPNGSKNFIGGIAGENKGIIEKCAFEGTVKGEDVVGGIAGDNRDTGQIIACSSAGNVIGENATGGIAGKNEGLILDCTNDARVNTEYEDKKREIGDINSDADAIIENYKSERDENEESSVLGHSDTGGIVGRSSGVVQGCVNNGNVGYQHIGYNVGGICGRQSGYLLGCENFGFIQGRKDVGGICGQMEPYILLNTSEYNLKNIRNELNSLRSMVDNFIADVDTLSDNSRMHLDNISVFAKTAQDNAEVLSNGVTDFIDDNISEINSQTAILSNTLDKLEPVFDDLENGADDIGLALEIISDAISEADFYSPDFDDEIDDLKDALDELSKVEKCIRRAHSRIKSALKDLDSALVVKNERDVRKALNELYLAIGDLISAKQDTKENIEKIENILAEKPESFEQIGINANQLLGCIKNIKSNTDTTISSLKTIEKSISTVANNTDIDYSMLKRATDDMTLAVDYLKDAVYYTIYALYDISDIMEDLSYKTEDYADDMIDEFEKMKDNIVDALDLLSYSAQDVAGAASKIGDIISDLANDEPAEFVKLGDGVKDASSNLFDSLTDISNEMDLLKNTLTDGKSTINQNLSSINNQFNVIMNLLIDEIEQITSGDEDISDRFLDVSEENIRSVKQGKVSGCNNFGKIEADRNTGGIVGAMAIEYTKDPEDDIEKPDKLGFTYKAKAVLYFCINDGEVISKKDCSGGIVGYEEIGTVYGCENYADTKSNNGSYVGGIAGQSESSISKSYSKCKLSGKKYIGGIAGKADIISQSYAIVNCSGDEYIGSICGDIEDKNLINRNYFVDNDLGAIDGISYKDKAEPITFDEIKDIQDIPHKFISFKVEFVVDDEIIATQEIKYRDETKRIVYPDIPEKEGYFGVWQKPESEYVTENIKVTCEYKPYITLLSSEEKSDNGKHALVLAEGEFTDEAKLKISTSNETPPEKTNVKVYDVSFKNTNIKETDMVTLRILNENKDKVTAWRLENGRWERIKTSGRGKYTVLQTQGADSVICLKYTNKGFNFIWVALFVLVVCAGAVVFLKKKKK